MVQEVAQVAGQTLPPESLFSYSSPVNDPAATGLAIAPVLVPAVAPIVPPAPTDEFLDEDFGGINFDEWDDEWDIDNDDAAVENVLNVDLEAELEGVLFDDWDEWEYHLEQDNVMRARLGYDVEKLQVVSRKLEF